MPEVKKPRISPDWEEYKAGTPEGIQESVDLIRSEVVSLRYLKDLVFTLLQDGDKGDGDKKTPVPQQDAAETPDTGPWIDAPNYRARIRAIRTDKNGAYQGTTLEALQDIPKVGKQGTIMILRNKNWENEFKRAQSAGKEICLRVSDGKVESIEVLS